MLKLEVELLWLELAELVTKLEKNRKSRWTVSNKCQQVSDWPDQVLSELDKLQTRGELTKFHLKSRTSEKISQCGDGGLEFKAVPQQQGCVRRSKLGQGLLIVGRGAFPRSLLTL